MSPPEPTTLDPNLPPPTAKRALRFYLGVGFILASYTPWLLLAALPFLGLSNEAMATIALSSWASGWAIFAFGAALAGKDGYAMIKGWITRAGR